MVNKTVEELQVVLDQYDTNKDGKLDNIELSKRKEDFAKKEGPAHDILKRRYVRDGGKLEDRHLQQLHADLHTTDLALRYLAFTGRAMKVVRYLAYTSDFGEAFRPVAHPMAVKAAYGVSWLYVGGDLANEANNMYNHHNVRGMDFAVGMAKRTTFQVLASILFPSLTIHAAVKYSKKLVFSRMAKGRLATLGPTFCGLAMVPALPYMFDEPLEVATDEAFAAVYPDSRHIGGTHH